MYVGFNANPTEHNRTPGRHPGHSSRTPTPMDSTGAGWLRTVDSAEQRQHRDSTEQRSGAGSREQDSRDRPPHTYESLEGGGCSIKGFLRFTRYLSKYEFNLHALVILWPL